MLCILYEVNLLALAPHIQIQGPVFITFYDRNNLVWKWSFIHSQQFTPFRLLHFKYNLIDLAGAEGRDHYEDNLLLILDFLVEKSENTKHKLNLKSSRDGVYKGHIQYFML